MTLPSVRRIKREDVPDAPVFLDGLLDPLNRFLDASYRLFDRGLRFGENIAATVRDVSFTTEATYTSNDWIDLRTQSGLRTAARSVTIQRIQIVADNEPVQFAATSLDWTEDSEGIVIRYVSGLANSTSYSMRLLIW